MLSVISMSVVCTANTYHFKVHARSCYVQNIAVAVFQRAAFQAGTNSCRYVALYLNYLEYLRLDLFVICKTLSLMACDGENIAECIECFRFSSHMKQSSQDHTL